MEDGKVNVEKTTKAQSKNLLENIFQKINPGIIATSFIIGLSYTLFYSNEFNYFKASGIPTEYIEFDKNNYFNFIVNIADKTYGKFPYIGPLSPHYKFITMIIIVIGLIIILSFAVKLVSKYCHSTFKKFITVLIIFVLIVSASLFTLTNFVCNIESNFCRSTSNLYYKYKDTVSNNTYYCKLIRKYNDKVLCEITYNTSQFALNGTKQIKMLQMKDDETFEVVDTNKFSGTSKILDEMRERAGRLPMEKDLEYSPSLQNRIEFILRKKKTIDIDLLELALDNEYIQDYTIRYDGLGNHNLIGFVNDLIYTKAITEDKLYYGYIIEGLPETKVETFYAFKANEKSIKLVNNLVKYYKDKGCKEAQYL